MVSSLNFEEIFQKLHEPVAICDENGFVELLNGAAERYLEPVADKRLRIMITSRETVRQIRLDQGLQEFFMAEIRVENAKRQVVSISLLELDSGGFRVSFANANPQGTSPSLRILESVININRHLPLFKTTDKVVALFASSFAEVFPDYAFTLTGGALAEYHHRGWANSSPQSVEGNFDSPNVPGEGLIWPQAKHGYRINLRESGEEGFLQVEKKQPGKFGVNEREAFETFSQQLTFAMARVRQPESEVSLVEPIIDQLDAVVLVCDARRRIRVANQTFESLVNDPNVVGRDLLEFFSENSQNQLRTSAASVMGSGGVETFDATLLDGSGTSSSQVMLRIQVAPNLAAHGLTSAGFIITGQISDMSIVELEERLSRAEHLMNLGELATGVAHELKNPLTSILNYADYLLRKYDETVFEEHDRARLRRIIEGVEHIDAFVHDLMTLARPEEGEWGPVDIHKPIKEAVAMCEFTLQEHGVTLVQSFGAPMYVQGSRGQLSQVFVNLFTNASRAMSAPGGHIYVTTKLEDGRVVCRVEDDASGMPKEVVEHVFEPFFTTRDSRGGTGLGLAIVREIVRRHQGRIDAESEIGVGTTFTVWLPEVT